MPDLIERSAARAELCRPIIGVEYRTPLEVFDIMCDRISRSIPAHRFTQGDVA